MSNKQPRGLRQYLPEKDRVLLQELESDIWYLQEGARADGQIQQAVNDILAGRYQYFSLYIQDGEPVVKSFNPILTGWEVSNDVHQIVGTIEQLVYEGYL